MSNRIFAATRKGLFRIERRTDSSKWEIAKTDFLGDPVTMVLPDARDGSVYAALNLGHFGVKIHRSPDNGESWEERPAPSYPQHSDDESKDEKSGSSVSLVQIWSLEAGGLDEDGLIWAGTIPGGLFRSKDRGCSWELVTALWDRPERKEWFGGGYDKPGIHSICIHPQNSKGVTVGISCGGVWTSIDGGESWECRSKGMRAEYMPPDRSEDPIIQDPHRIVQCKSSPNVFWAQHHNGIFRSIDDAALWHEIKDVSPSTFGFAAAVHPNDSDTAWFAPAVKDERRIPVDARLAVTRTRDGGRSFDALRNGLPQEHAYDLVYRHGLDIDETGDRLVMGSTTGGLWITEDQGDAWQCISAHLPPIYCVRFA